ncbi:unnamed protein product [Medioppia subpectinata]|uniref:Uncharacterized protein n=1 Tax=Medioppia subpectinata TaxID=1979941 RepID=A0A7R9KVN1_9ACAR|nr:unnamed protein product [Medioppia subpectinata]CAG2110327.1 unnamed protein product [Medioppia subpectinata]
MDTSYSPSAVVNTNIAENSANNESKDLGQEFLSQTPNRLVVDKIPAPIVANDYCCADELIGQPLVTCDGSLAINLFKGIRVDINANHSIYVSMGDSKVSVSNSGQNIGVVHRFGRVFKELVPQNNCHIESGIHLAKMCGRGITFTSLNRSLIYLVDSSGCKTTTERFRKLNHDFSLDIFNSHALSADYGRQRAFADLIRGSYEVSEEGDEKFWYFPGLRIRQHVLTGDLMITKSYGKVVVYMNPSENSVKVNAPNLRITATNRPDSCLSIIKPHSKDEQRVTAGFNNFRVKYGSQKAGFDANDELVLI